MKKQIWNPYLPLDEYIPDGEPHVFGDRLYVFGSHDKENGKEFCELDYTVWSAPLKDLSDWTNEGIIYRKEQDPENKALSPLYAPDVCKGADGRYYLYYSVKFSGYISVAVCDTPAGQYEYLGRVSYGDGRVMTENQPYDPAVLCEDGRTFLYFGFAPILLNLERYKGLDLKGCSVVELEEDMLTVKEGPRVVLPSQLYAAGTSFEGNAYFEAPSVRKIGRLYYLVYSSVNTHQLCYAVSDSPMKGFVYGGVIISNGDVGYQGRTEKDKLMSVGNNHGGLVEVNGQWYIFYHRHTHTNQYNRQGCAEPVSIEADGSIKQVTITTSGMNPGPLSGKGEYPAVICCNLTNGHMGALSSLGRTSQETDFPYITNDGEERFVSNIQNGVLLGYKYIDLRETKRIGLWYRGNGRGCIEVRSDINGPGKAEILIEPAEEWSYTEGEVCFSKEDRELYLVYHGDQKVDIKEICLL